MDRAQLKAWLDDGMSLEQIAALVDRDPSTVGYWVKRYGFEANGRRRHAPRGGLSADELKPLVEAGLAFREIAARVDRSVATVRYWIKRHGLGEPRQFRRKQIDEAVENGTRTVSRRCKRHGWTDYALVGADRRPRCKKCRAEAVARRRRKVKATLVEEKGGACIICGYDRNLNALHFHHVDPTTKLFGVAHRGLTRSIEEVRREVDKCVLLCSNCHSEVEAGTASLPI